ncbi:MAG: hypothetical protein QOF89_1530 [Acidobacteriota bacterium]|nr:hypothetical protein [Acidobacteriota bacterium]
MCPVSKSRIPCPYLSSGRLPLLPRPGTEGPPSGYGAGPRRSRRSRRPSPARSRRSPAPSVERPDPFLLMQITSNLLHIRIIVLQNPPRRRLGASGPQPASWVELQDPTNEYPDPWVRPATPQGLLQIARFLQQNSHVLQHNRSLSQLTAWAGCCDLRVGRPGSGILQHNSRIWQHISRVLQPDPGHWQQTRWFWHQPDSWP